MKRNKTNLVDYKYNNEIVSRFVSILMLRGKKSVALRVVYGAIDWVSSQVEGDSIEIFQQALNNVKPHVEVKSKRIGGATLQIPIEIDAQRQEALAMRWLVRFARKRTGKSMIEKLGRELLDAYNSTGGTFKKMEETHNMAEANKAFSHYRM